MAVQKKINIQNKKARFEFEILDKYVAGIQLTGTEIKSIRLSQARITESFCEFNEGGELFIVNMYIQEYLFGHQYNHKPKSERRLLMITARCALTSAYAIRTTLTSTAMR